MNLNKKFKLSVASLGEQRKLDTQNLHRLIYITPHKKKQNPRLSEGFNESLFKF